MIQNIGKRGGKLLVFGGVYSNLQALEQLMQIAESVGVAPDHVICTGDVVGYCAQPEECVQLIRDWGIHSIAGNVEIQLREGQDDCGCDFSSGGRCDIFSRQWYPFAQEKLSDASIGWMKGLPDFIQLEFAGKKGVVLHGSWHETAGYIFASTPWDIKEKSLADAGADFVLAGHCGLPFHHAENEKYWLNPGVIGMPANDGSTRVWYMILEESDFTFEHLNFDYDFQEAARLMQAKGLPLPYAQTLQTGIWDNCEILPEEESRLQGKSISFA